MELRWTSITPDDTTAWSELTAALAAADDTDETYSAADLAEELQEHNFDPARDSWAVWDGPIMVAFGQLRVAGVTQDGYVRASLDGGVHPDYRGRGVGRRLLDLMEPRALALAIERHPGQPVGLGGSGQTQGSSARRLFEHRGYQPMRYFTSMRIDLQAARIDHPAVPVTPYSAERAEPLRQAHNEAFSTHWGSTGHSPQEWQEFVGSRAFRPSTTVLALDGDVVQGYTGTAQWEEGELYVAIVGTRVAARGRGLARACLQESLRLAQGGGYRSATLHVDSQNPTGAGRLYESVGFVPVRTSAAMVRVVPAA